MTENEHHGSLWKWIWSAGVALGFTSSCALIVVLACVSEEVAKVLRIAHGIVAENKPIEIFVRAIFVWILLTVVVRIFIENDEENDDGE